MDMSQEPFSARKYRENAGGQDRDAVQMHMDIPQEQFHARIYRENAGAHDWIAAQTLCELA